MKCYRENKTEYDVDMIKEILKDVPEKELPFGFNEDLRHKLEIEKSRAKVKINPSGKKKRLTLVFPLAACVMVGILLYSMYNDPAGSDDLYNTGTAESYNTDVSADIYDFSSSKLQRAGTKAKDDDNDFRNAAICESGASYDYEKKIKSYLHDPEFHIISQNEDKNSGQIHFKILILADKEGKPVNKIINLIEDGGELYELEE